MIRVLLEGLGKLALLFALTVGAIRAQPYSDGGLNAVLYTPGCAPPCFLGIRPGETTWRDAIERLRASPWIASVDARENAPSLSWRWNGSQPAFLRDDESGNHLYFSTGIVTRILLLSDANAATITLALGTPRVWYYYTGSSVDPYHLGIPIYFEQRAVYDDLEVGASSDSCPLTLRQQWALPTQISMPPLPDHSRYQISTQALITLPSDCR